MKPLEIVFWTCTLCVLYTYALYPMILGILSRVCRRRLADVGPSPRSITVVMAAFNEEATIGRRVREFTAMIASSTLEGEVIVVSDGSTDKTATIAREVEGPVRVFERAENRGKAVSLSEGCAVAWGEILVFGDTRQRWAPDALSRLVNDFRDPTVGGVSGDLVLESGTGVAAGVSLYWRFEKWIRRIESRVHSTVGVTGAICAVRRTLFQAIPPGTILDDVYWPLRVVMQGARVIHDDRAHAFDQLPRRPSDEFRRKVRTLCGNLQLMARLPSILLPWRNPIWWQFISHKALRLVVPWALLGMLTSSALIRAPLYRILFWGQVALYLTALAGTFREVNARSRIASAAASFLVLNAAAWVAFWIWITGKEAQSWSKVSYVAASNGCPD